MRIDNNGIVGIGGAGLVNVANGQGITTIQLNGNNPILEGAPPNGGLVKVADVQGNTTIQLSGNNGSIHVRLVAADLKPFIMPHPTQPDTTSCTHVSKDRRQRSTFAEQDTSLTVRPASACPITSRTLPISIR
jgi:hypothetical protein